MRMSDHNSHSVSGIGICSCGSGPVPLQKNISAQHYLPPDVVHVRWEGSKKFQVKNARGGSLVLEEGSEQCSPCDVFMAALGGCANLALLAQLQKNSVKPEKLEVQVSGTRKTGLPSAYQKIHVTFSLACKADDSALDTMITQAMTVFCPVAVTLGRVAEVTWEFHRT